MLAHEVGAHRHEVERDRVFGFEVVLAPEGFGAGWKPLRLQMRNRPRCPAGRVVAVDPAERNVAEQIEEPEALAAFRRPPDDGEPDARQQAFDQVGGCGSDLQLVNGMSGKGLLARASRRRRSSSSRRSFSSSSRLCSSRRRRSCSCFSSCRTPRSRRDLCRHRGPSAAPRRAAPRAPGPRGRAAAAAAASRETAARRRRWPRHRPATPRVASAPWPPRRSSGWRGLRRTTLKFSS